MSVDSFKTWMEYDTFFPRMPVGRAGDRVMAIDGRDVFAGFMRYVLVGV
jgi:hypothetical protein